MMWIRGSIAAATLIIILGSVGWSIVQKEAILIDGRTILLPMAPVDPRSLMQGDYMRLGYHTSLFPKAETIETLPYKGLVILSISENSEVSFARLDDGKPLLNSEIKIVYRRSSANWGRVRIKYAPDSYFFEEGEADRYAVARFVMLSVAENGEVVLTGLAGVDGIRIPDQAP